MSSSPEALARPKPPTDVAHVRMRFFAAAREATGCTTTDLEVATLGDALAAARASYGVEFGAVLDCARVWVNGEEPDAGDRAVLHDGDEVAVIPPVSGG